MSIFDSIFGTNKNPADAANPYFDKIRDAAQQGYGPYAAMGQDPSGYYEKLMKDYKPSSSYQMKLDEGLKAAGNAAAAGGMRGTQADLMNSSRIADSLLGDDMQQWLNNIFGIQGRGFEGQKNLTDTLTNSYGSQGSLAFQGQREQNQGQGDLLKSLLGLLGTAGGAFFGGPAGAAVGGATGNAVGNWMK